MRIGSLLLLGLAGCGSIAAPMSEAEYAAELEAVLIEVIDMCPGDDEDCEFEWLVVDPEDEPGNVCPEGSWWRLWVNRGNRHRFHLCSPCEASDSVLQSLDASNLFDHQIARLKRCLRAAITYAYTYPAPYTYTYPGA